MKDIKDNFSQQAGVYAQYRPVYPDELYQFIFEKLSTFDAAWDCGTGNGQVAARLAERFKEVYATDISQKQLDNATAKNNITYKNERAEQISVPANSFDLITIAQAIHWFDFDAFYKEVKRVSKPGCIIVIWTYHLVRIEPAIDELIDDYYYNIVGPYWDTERKYVDEHYKTIPFPFKEIEAPEFEIIADWNINHLLGYLNSWSSVMHYKKERQTDPVILLKDQLSNLWPEGITKTIRFPVYMRMGEVIKQDDHATCKEQ